MPSSFLSLSGTHLEGGGQLLRNAICLSALLNKPVEINSVRGNRKDGGGLKSQHLVSLLWLATASAATVEGAVKGGKNVKFYPGNGQAFWKKFAKQKERSNGKQKGRKERGRKYFVGEGEQNAAEFTGDPDSEPPHLTRQIKIDIGTPGSVFLVFQAVLPFVLFKSANFLPGADQGGIITLTITGGTNTTLAPSYEYTSQVYLPTLLKHVGLPGIRVNLDKRCWAFGSPIDQEIGRVTFEIDVLQTGQGIRGFIMEGNGRKAAGKRLERISKVTVTIVVPTETDFYVFEKKARDLIWTVDWNEEGHKDVEVEISALSETTGEGSRNYYVLLHATTSPSGYLLGYDYLYTAPSGKSKGKKIKRKMPQVKEPRDKAFPKETLAEGIISKPLQKLLCRWKSGSITDEYLQDQLVIWQALAEGWSFVEAIDGGEGYGASDPLNSLLSREASGIGDLHTRTARWVAEQIAGVKWEGKGKAGCYGIGLRAGQSPYVTSAMADAVGQSHMG